MKSAASLYDARRISLKFFLKRSLDVFSSILLLCVLSPLFVLVAIAVGIDGGPIFFSQKRIGRNGNVFPCYKFRSMRVGAEETITHHLLNNPQEKEKWDTYQKLENDARITAVGKIIRKTSLDELPQLWNVLCGDMSLVGPRPITPDQLERYGKNLIYYTAVRPGITGPWQVGGRNKLPFSERITLESEYAQNWNLLTDVQIMAKTVPAIFKTENAS